MELIQVIVWALALGLIVWLVNYIVDTIPIPEPFGRVIKIIAVVLAVLVLIVLLFKLASLGISLSVIK